MNDPRTVSIGGVLLLVIGVGLFLVRELLSGIWAGLWVFFVGTGVVLLLYGGLRMSIL